MLTTVDSSVSGTFTVGNPYTAVIEFDETVLDSDGASTNGQYTDAIISAS